MLCVALGGVWLMAPALVTNLDRLIARHPYVSFNAWDLPFLLATPIFLALAIGIVLRVSNRATAARMQAVMKVALVFSVIAVAVRIVYGIAGATYLGNAGYTRCWSLSSPAMMAPTVYVKNQNYCLDNVGHVRQALLAWIDRNASGNQPLDQQALENKASRLLSAERQSWPR